MINMKSVTTYTGAGLLSAVAASLCCITPVFALLAGTSTIVSNLTWIDPARPYLIGLSIAVLAFAWYSHITQERKERIDCNCETSVKAPFLQSKSFLSIVTVVTILMMTFPLYAKFLHPNQQTASALVAELATKRQVLFTIEGMTCESCEPHVNNELSKVPGVLTRKTSYSSGNSLVTFDSSKVSIKELERAINRTGYKVKKYNNIDARTP